MRSDPSRKHWDPGSGGEGAPEGTKLGASLATSYPDDKSFLIPLSLGLLIYKIGTAMLPFHVYEQ